MDKDTAVVLDEYCGMFSETRKCEKCKREYVRTHPSELETVKSECDEVGSKP